MTLRQTNMRYALANKAEVFIRTFFWNSSMKRKYHAELSLEAIPSSSHYIGSLSFEDEEYAVQCHGRPNGMKVMLAKTRGRRPDAHARESFIPSQVNRHSPQRSECQMIDELPGKLSRMHPSLRGVSIKLSK